MVKMILLVGADKTSANIALKSNRSSFFKLRVVFWTTGGFWVVNFCELNFATE
jgi:hypothetical protein